MEPRFADKDSFYVVGAAARGQLADFNYGDIWEKQYMPFDEQLKTLSMDGGYYGVTLGEEDHLVYVAGVGISSPLEELPQGAEMHKVPAAHYAVFDCTMDTIGPTWQTAYEKWLPGSAYELDTDAVDFEYYPPHSGEGEMKVEIYIPVKVKEKV